MSWLYVYMLLLICFFNIYWYWWSCLFVAHFLFCFFVYDGGGALFISFNPLLFFFYIYVDNDEAFLSVFDFLLFFSETMSWKLCQVYNFLFWFTSAGFIFYTLYLAALKLAAWFSYSDEGLSWYKISREWELLVLDVKIVLVVQVCCWRGRSRKHGHCKRGAPWPLEQAIFDRDPIISHWQ